MLRDRPVHEHRRARPSASSSRWRRRGDRTMKPSTSPRGSEPRGPPPPDARPCPRAAPGARLPGRCAPPTARAREVRVRDVRHDHRHVAGAAGDQATGRPVRHEPELAHRRLDPLPGGRRHLLGAAQRPRHRPGVDPGPGGDIEDRDPLSCAARRPTLRRRAPVADTPVTDPQAPRLSARTLARARAATIPTYDRSPVPGIAHLGVGAFARAHLGVYADDLLARGWPAMIRGVSLGAAAPRSSSRRRTASTPSTEREPAGDAPLRVIGSVTSVAHRPGGGGRRHRGADHHAGDADRHREGLRGGTRGPRASRPAAVRADGRGPRTRPSPRSRPPPVVASLDNLLDNGTRPPRPGARGRRRARRRRWPGWIADEVRFPSSVVDRMVPATTPARPRGHRPPPRPARPGRRRRRAPPLLGDRATSTAFPPLGDVGVEVVADVGPYQRRKLWLLNGPHSALAYGGLLAGCDTIAEACRPPDGVALRARGSSTTSSRWPTRRAPSQPAAFAEEALRRFANPDLGHTCAPGRSRRFAEAPAAAAARGGPPRRSAGSTPTASPSSWPRGSPRSPASRCAGVAAAGARRPGGARPRRRRSTGTCERSRRVRAHAAGRVRRRGGRRTRAADARGRRACSRRRHDRDPRRADRVARRRRGRGVRRGAARPRSTSTAARCASSSPTPPARARCRCCSARSTGAVAGRVALVHRGRRPRHPRADGRRRACGPSSASTASRS